MSHESKPSTAWSRQELESQLTTKAWKDATFQQALINDPKSVISREFGVLIPANIEIKVMAEDSKTLYLVLPMNPDAETSAELDDADLEAVVGGVIQKPGEQITGYCGTDPCEPSTLPHNTACQGRVVR